MVTAVLGRLDAIARVESRVSPMAEAVLRGETWLIASGLYDEATQHPGTCRAARSYA
jgi:hypothetical protein